MLCKKNKTKIKPHVIFIYADRYILRVWRDAEQSDGYLWGRVRKEEGWLERLFLLPV